MDRDRIMTSHTSTRGIRIRLLGGFAVVRDGEALDDRAWRSRKAQSLVKILACEPSHRLHREQIVDRLWPRLDLDAAERQLHKAIHAARRALEPSLEVVAESTLLVTRDRMVALETSASVSVDADLFETAANAALAAADAAATKAAIDLYAGDVLPEELYEEWAEPRRLRLKTLHLRLLGHLAEQYRDAGRLNEAIEIASRLLAAEPSNERAHRALIAAYAAAGDRHRAMLQYRDCVRILREDLDIAPSAETEALYASVLEATDERVATPKPSTPAAAAPVLVRRSVRRRALIAVGCAVVLALGLGYPLARTEAMRDLASAFGDGLGPARPAVTLVGRLDRPAIQIQQIGSQSGWAALTDAQGHFELFGVSWRPGAWCSLLVTTDAGPASLYSIRLPDTPPESGVVDLGDLRDVASRPVDPAAMRGTNAVSHIAYDAANDGWYRAVFWTITMDKASDPDRVAAVNAFVANRYTALSGPDLPRTPRETLERGSRFSGPLVSAFASLMHAGGYDVRIVALGARAKEIPPHTVVEVFYGGAWHLYDPAYGVSVVNDYGHVASQAQILQNPALVERMGYGAAVRPGWRTDLADLYTTGAYHYYVFEDR